ncbi:CrcB protein [Agrococcus casei LMG 22410]|uniref:Fluoride-specific ion channel FluC n=2 Tax=Agrococcus TaxID=46352 RepID=A0A1R4G876_9MICO|nr:CrcB protein [Agrococcus casei LMG 22410]
MLCMPLTLLAVALGGAAGTLLRLLADLAMPEQGLPWSTVAVNLIGSLVLGVLAGRAASDRVRWPAWLREGVQTGLLGGFTTYSALALWGASAADAAPTLLSVLLVMGVAVAGVAVAYAGLSIGSRTATKGTR